MSGAMMTGNLLTTAGISAVVAAGVQWVSQFTGWFNGNNITLADAAPLATQGRDGDVWVDSTTFIFYVKAAGNWVSKGTPETNAAALTDVTVDSIDANSAADLPIGAATATSVSLAVSGVDTNIEGPLVAKETLAVTGESTFTGQVTMDGGMLLTQPNVVAGATRSITAAESGTVFTVVNSTARTYTLPPVAAGLNYKFIMTTTGALVKILSQDGFMAGTLAYPTSTTDNAVNGLVANGTTHLSFSFATGNTAGAWGEVYSDGTKWFVKGMGTIATGITVGTS